LNFEFHVYAVWDLTLGVVLSSPGASASLSDRGGKNNTQIKP